MGSDTMAGMGGATNVVEGTDMDALESSHSTRGVNMGAR